MKSRKMMKSSAREAVNKHYFLYMIICIVVAFLGVENGQTINITKWYIDDPVYLEEEVEYADDIAMRKVGLVDVVATALKGNLEEGKKMSNDITKSAIESSEKKENNALGRSEGVFAKIVNDVTSGSFFVTIISAINSIVGSANITLAICVVLCLIGFLAFWFFIVDILKVVARRIFLEGTIYEKVPIQRFLFLIKAKKWSKVALTMFLTALFEALWAFTIVGAVIKRYSYFMVPFIVAENPDIAPLEAIRLSKRMMIGHKWECFVFEMSFIGWNILGILTMGASSVFYSNMYKLASFTEYYIKMRKIAKKEHVVGSELLNDKYLFEKASTSILQKKYSDIVVLMEESVQKNEKYDVKGDGIRGFLSRNLGVSFYGRQKEEEIERKEVNAIRINAYKDVIDRKSYPLRLFTIPERMTRQKVGALHYMRHYSVWSLIMMFFIFAIFGWVWEVGLHLVTTGDFVKRGVMHGPWLPIYGAGAVVILLLLYRLRQKPVLEVISIIVLCGVIEYFTGYYLEIKYNGMKWWDYSGYFLNLDGRICAEGLMVFGIGGASVVYFVAPMLDNYLKKIKYRIAIPTCVTLMGVFVTDMIISNNTPNMGKGVSHYSKELEGTDDIVIPQGFKLDNFTEEGHENR